MDDFSSIANGSVTLEDIEPKRRGRPRKQKEEEEKKTRAQVEEEKFLAGATEWQGGVVFALNSVNDMAKKTAVGELWTAAQIDAGSVYLGRVLQRYMPQDRLDPDVVGAILVLAVPVLPKLLEFIHARDETA